MQIYSMKGYYHAKKVPSCYPDTDAAIDHYRKSANFYIEAANVLPEDDESHACELIIKHAKPWNGLTSYFLRLPQLWCRESFQLRDTPSRNFSSP